MIPVAVSLLSRIEGRVMRIYKLPMIADRITDRGQGREKTLVEIDSIDDSTITVIDRSIHRSIEKVIKRYGNRHGLTLVELASLVANRSKDSNPTLCFSITVCNGFFLITPMLESF